MVKTFGLVALAAVAALILGFGSNLGSGAPRASADTTDVAVIGCEFIAGAVDGNTTNTLDAASVAAACGTAPIPQVEDTTDAPTNPNISIARLASAIGNKDGKLTKSDFAAIEGYDANQISTDCKAANSTVANPIPAITVAGLLNGFSCSLDVFVFVNDEQPVTLDLPSGLASVQNGNLDFICNTDGPAGPVNQGANPVLGTDNDCSQTAPNNGDGVVLFNILNDNASAGSVKTVNVIQEAVAQSFDVNVVGSANNVALTLVESTISTSGSTANMVTCQGDAADTTTPGGLGIPGTAVDSITAVTDPRSTIAYAVTTDQSDTVLTRTPVIFSISPPSDINNKAALGAGNPFESVTGDTFFTLDPDTTSSTVPIAAYVVVCGGKSTGNTTINADINLVSCGLTGCNVLSSKDHSEKPLTVVGAPSAVALTASASQIKCDSSETSTVTAKVTDSAGNNVADGTAVSFSVVALGTANPINTTTTAGVATSVITPLSNSSAGVTVIVTAGDSAIATQVQTSILIGCTLPLATQPTLAPPVAPTSTPRTGIAGPDTGNGGYLAQDGSSFPTWTLIVLALGSVALVAGGAVARRAGK